MLIKKIFVSLHLASLVIGMEPSLGLAQVSVTSPSPAPIPAALDLGFLSLPAQDIERVPEGKPDSESVKIKVGDEVKLHIKALSLPGVTNPSKDLFLQVPAGTENLTDQGWELIPDTAQNSAEMATEFRFRAVPLKAGRLILPSLALVPQGKPVSGAVARTQPFTLEVESAVASDDPKPEEAVDLRPPVSLRFPLWVIAAGVVLFLGLVAGLIFAYRRYRNAKPKTLPAAPAEPPRPEDEVALAALAALERSGPVKRGEFKAHYFGISEILKTYLGERYRVDAVESTTREMIAALEERRSIGDPQLDRLESIFSKLDLVKFTDHIPLPDEGLKLLQSARELVMMTRRPPNATTSATTPKGSTP